MTNPIADPPVTEPEARVYFQEYEQVWRATQLALRKYPIRINNIDSGIIETDFIRGDKYFSDPKDEKPKTGLRYKLTVRAVKGRVDGKSAIEVTILKTAELQTDFFSGAKSVSSNGLEEQVILYRIGRYLEIDRVVTKSSGPSY